MKSARQVVTPQVKLSSSVSKLEPAGHLRPAIYFSAAHDMTPPTNLWLVTSSEIKLLQWRLKRHLFSALKISTAQDENEEGKPQVQSRIRCTKVGL